MKVAFLIHHFSIRGTEVSIYNYALYNELVLKNESIIVVPSNYNTHRHYTGMIVNCEQVEEKFREKFNIRVFSSYDHLDVILQNEGCSVLYHQKSGENDIFYKFSIPYVVHCVFTCNSKEKHGDVYAAISEDIISDGLDAPVIPYICISLPKVKENLREKLNIPSDAIVFGRHGGIETFDIPFVHETIKNVVNKYNNIYFLFMNTYNFFSHPQIIYLERSADVNLKSLFVNSCDAMLYARKQGESFGLSIAEFTTLEKPIIVHKYPDRDSNHIKVLGDTAIYYEDENDLYNILTTFETIIAPIPVNYSKIFTPSDVMSKFKKHFLDIIN